MVEKGRDNPEAGNLLNMVLLPCKTDATELGPRNVEQLLLRGESYQQVIQNPIGQVLQKTTSK